MTKYYIMIGNKKVDITDSVIIEVDEDNLISLTEKGKKLVEDNEYKDIDYYVKQWIKKAGDGDIITIDEIKMRMLMSTGQECKINKKVYTKCVKNNGLVQSRENINGKWRMVWRKISNAKDMPF